MEKSYTKNKGTFDNSSKISKSPLIREYKIAGDEKKVAPSSIEAEQSLLGCLLLDKDAIVKVADLITAEDFYHDHHKFIYESVIELFHRSEPIDTVTVSTKLQASNKLEVIGGPEYLATIQNSVPLSTHVFQYAQIIKHRSTLRKLIKAGSDIVSLGYNMDKKVTELLESAEKKIFSISETFIKNRFVPIKEVLTTNYEKFCEINENPELAYKNKISASFRDINDKLNGGFNPSDLIIVAARPSMGKTAFTLEIGLRAAINQNKKIGIISLEMSKEQLVDRMLCSRLGIDSWKLHRGQLDNADFERMGIVMEELSSASLYIDDSMGSSIVELRAKARRLKMEYGLDMMVIDYLQLMSGGNPMNRVQEISEISRSLKQLARELKIPIIALSQLSRGVEARPDKRPILSDLRDSGSIEQDADIVMMLYRDDYYNPESEEKNILEVNILKHRNGGLGRTKVLFDRSKMSFSDLDENYSSGF